MNKNVYENVDVNEKLVVEDIVVEDVEMRECQLIFEIPMSMTRSMAGVDIDDIAGLEVGDANGKASFKT